MWWQTDSLHWLRFGNHQRRQCVRLKRFIIGAQFSLAVTSRSLNKSVDVSADFVDSTLSASHPSGCLWQAQRTLKARDTS
ncbi:hypothetical protein [uncultured Tolumonas sp.]|uniref:hypothetical protein n=1 Tax=uncultured Tolumonas sp. TaxID=263765 RepID=UPI002A0A7B6D|nr:hypothetical protein [uncultured Tolumonas sp.]